MNQQQESNAPPPANDGGPGKQRLNHYRVQFRPAEQVCSASSRIQGLHREDIVMVQTDHGLEPARVRAIMVLWPEQASLEAPPLTIVRRATRDEAVKYDRLSEMEQSAFQICAGFIEKFKLPMNLVKVERFFNGGKIIFYFTAENRVDFRELVKNLVQEFRTRVEMRQIGVRHETKMLGGLGCCGRELCCSSFIQNFESVSIKMAKEQNLPLNPAKISGACNRLLCCLNYEYSTYKSTRKAMPKIGKHLTFNNRKYKVRQHIVLSESIVVIGEDGEELKLKKEEWQAASLSAPKNT